MKEILKMMAARKYDEDLKDTYRTIFDHCGSDSLLRKLYFESASFWKFGFEEGDYSLRGAAGDLGLDPTPDRLLIDALKEHRDAFCRCPLTKVRANHLSEQPKRPPPRLRRKQTRVCNCEKEPWNLADRFYNMP